MYTIECEPLSLLSNIYYINYIIDIRYYVEYRM